MQVVNTTIEDKVDIITEVQDRSPCEEVTAQETDKIKYEADDIVSVTSNLNQSIENGQNMILPQQIVTTGKKASHKL